VVLVETWSARSGSGSAEWTEAEDSSAALYADIVCVSPGRQYAALLRKHDRGPTACLPPTVDLFVYFIYLVVVILHGRYAADIYTHYY